MARRPRPGVPSLGRRFRRDTSGSVAIITAAFLILIGLLAMFAVDLGSIYVAKRRAQGANDIAAELAAQDLSHAEQIARATLARNGIAAIDALAVTKGTYRRDPGIAADARFSADGTPANAVKLRLRTRADLSFARFLFPGGTVPLDVESIGAARRVAALSIGSRLVSVNGGILNAFLKATLGADVALTAVDYNALANTQVSLFGFLDALASRLDLTAVNYDTVLAADATPGTLLDAAHAAIASGQGGTGPAALLTLAQASSGTSATIQASRLIALGDEGRRPVGSSAAALSASVSALSLISAIASVANGDHQVSLGSGITLPGIASVALDVQIGERPVSSPWLSLGEAGAAVHTAQVWVALRVTVGGSGLLSAVSLRLPIVVEVAQAEARLNDIDCTRRGAPSVDVRATPGILNGWIGETTPFALERFDDPGAVKPARLFSALGIAVTAKAQARIGSMTEQALTFDWTDIAQHASKTVTTRDYTRSLVASLLDSADIKVTVVGIPLLPVNLVVGAVLSSLSPLTATLDGALNAVLAIAGVNLGQADIWVNGARCNLGLVG